MQSHWLTRVYLAFLALFPVEYRSAYGEELTYAIHRAVADARARGRWALAGLAWRELRDLPLALLRARLRQWEDCAMRLQAGVHLPYGPIRNYRLAALFVPFAIPLSNVIPAQVGGVGLQVLGRYLALVLIGLAIVTAVTGLVKGFPAWTLPTLGALLFVAWTALKWRAQPAILSALGQGSIYWPDALPDRLGIVARLNVASLAIALLMVVLVLLIFPGLWARSRRDWSLLSFMLYGLAIPYPFLYDAYRGLEPYEAVSALLLAAGAALFVLAPRRWQRLLGLAGALLLAQPVVSLGIYLIFPGQTFASPNQLHRLWETLQPVIELPVLLILVCLPALLSRLPAPGSRTPAFAPGHIENC